MDGENNGKPYDKMDDLAKTHYFRKHPYLTSPGVMWGGGVIFIMMQSLRWYTLQN